MGLLIFKNCINKKVKLNVAHDTDEVHLFL